MHAMFEQLMILFRISYIVNWTNDLLLLILFSERNSRKTLLNTGTQTEEASNIFYLIDILDQSQGEKVYAFPPELMVYLIPTLL